MREAPVFAHNRSLRKTSLEVRPPLFVGCETGWTSKKRSPAPRTDRALRAVGELLRRVRISYATIGLRFATGSP
jgi:hypothetical protein